MKSKDVGMKCKIKILNKYTRKLESREKTCKDLKVLKQILKGIRYA
jgi:hypothetical protein